MIIIQMVACQVWIPVLAVVACNLHVGNNPKNYTGKRPQTACGGKKPMYQIQARAMEQ